MVRFGVEVVRIVFAGNEIGVVPTHDHADNSVVISRSPLISDSSL